MLLLLFWVWVQKKRPKPLFLNRSRSLVAVKNAASPIEAGHPVAVFHVLDTDFSSCTRCMEEMIVAEVDANVREGATHRIKEDQIAWLELANVNLLANFAHLARSPGQGSADTVLEHQTNEATTVQALIFVVATEAVAHTDQLQTLQDDILSGVGVTFQERRLLLFAHLLGGDGRTAGAKNQRRSKEQGS